jgi:hypothetical protein
LNEGIEGLGRMIGKYLDVEKIKGIIIKDLQVQLEILEQQFKEL